MVGDDKIIDNLTLTGCIDELDQLQEQNIPAQMRATAKEKSLLIIDAEAKQVMSKQNLTLRHSQLMAAIRRDVKCGFKCRGRKRHFTIGLWHFGTDREILGLSPSNKSLVYSYEAGNFNQIDKVLGNKWDLFYNSATKSWKFVTRLRIRLNMCSGYMMGTAYYADTHLDLCQYKNYRSEIAKTELPTEGEDSGSEVEPEAAK